MTSNMLKGLSIGIIAIVLFVPSSLVFADDSNSTFIPNWVKGVAGWWAEGKISDSDFQQAIQFLVNVGVIHVSNATTVITDLQQNATLTFGESNSTQVISFQESNATQPVVQSFTLDTLKDSAMNWSSGKTTDSAYFADVQKAIDSGLIGPVAGDQIYIDTVKTDPTILATIKEQTYFASTVSWTEGDGFSEYLKQVNLLYQCGFVHN